MHQKSRPFEIEIAANYGIDLTALTIVNRKLIKTVFHFYRIVAGSASIKYLHTVVYGRGRFERKR